MCIQDRLSIDGSYRQGRRINPTCRAVALPLFVLGLFLADAATGQAPSELAGHSASINSVVYTANQTYVITAGADQVIKIWDSKTGKEVRSLQGHTGQVLSLAGSPDSATVISGAADNTIRVWDVPRLDPLRVFLGPTAAVRGVAVSPNGKWAVSFGDDRMGRVWNLEDGSAAVLLKGHDRKALRVAVRADNNQIASGDLAGNVRLWDSAEGKPLGIIGAHVGAVRGLIFHPNNQQLVSAGEDGLVKTWQLPLLEPRLLTGHGTPVRTVAVTSNGQLVVTGSNDSVRVFNVANGQAVRELAGATGATSAAAISANNALAAAAGKSGVIKFWNLADGADRLHIAGHDQPIAALAFHPDNARIASAGDDGTLRIWRLPVAPVPLAGHTADVVAVAVSPVGQLAATASADKSLRIWNPSNGQAIRQLNGHERPLTDVTFRDDGAQLASGDALGEVRLWNSADGAAAGVIGAHAGPLHAAAYHPAGDKLATVGGDDCLKVWKLPLPPARAFAGNAAAVKAVAMSSDGKILITGGSDKTLRVFDPVSGQQTRTFPDAPEAVTALKLSHDDVLTAAGAENGVIKLWHTADGAPWKGVIPAKPDAKTIPAAPVLLGHDGAVLSLAFDRQSKQIASAGADGAVRLWRLPAPPKVVQAETGPSTAFVVSPDGKTAASSGVFQGRPAVFVWDLKGEKIIHTLLGHEAPVNTITFSADGSKVATGSADKTARVWNLADTKFPETRKIVQANAVTAVALGDKATHLYTAAGENVIRCWSVADGSEVRSFAGHGGAVSALAVSGETLVSGSADGTLRLWNTQTGAAVRTLNHAAAVTSLDVSQDGGHIASGGADKLVKVWNAKDGSAVASLSGHAAAIISLRFHPDGSRLASIASDGIWLWEVARQRRLESFAYSQNALRGVGFFGDSIAVGVGDGSLRLIAPHLLHLIEAHANGAHAVTFTPDGIRLVSGGADKSVKIWKRTDAKQIAAFTTPSDVVTCVAVTPNGNRVVAGGLDKKIRVWSLPASPDEKHSSVEDEYEQAAPIRDVSLSADGRRVAVGGDDNIVRVFDLNLGRELQRFAGHTAPVLSVAISADGNTVFTGSADKTARLSTLALTQITLVPAAQNDLSFLRDSSRLVGAGNDAILRFWKLGKAVLQSDGTLSKGTDPQLALAVRSDGAQLASLDKKGRTHVWDVAAGKLAYVIDPPQQEMKDEQMPPRGGLQFSADDSKLAVGYGGQVRVFQSDDGRLLESFDESTAVAGVAFALDNQTLAIGRAGKQENAALRRVSLERLIKAHKGAATALSFTPDGNGLASCGADKLVQLWNVADGKLRQTYSGSEDALSSVAVTRDAIHIAAGGLDKAVRVWPVNPPAPQDENTPPDPVAAKATFTFPAAVRSVSVSFDNQKIAVCGDDGVIYVREIASGHECQRFAGHEQAALAVAFAPDNRTLISAGADKSARVWTMSLLRTIAAEEEAITDLSLAAGGAQAVTTGGGGVQQWNLANGSLIRKFEGGDAAFLTAAVRNDNAQIVAADEARQVYLWNYANGQLTASFKAPARVAHVRYSPDNQKIVAACEDNVLRFYNPADGTQTYELTSNGPVDAPVFTTDSRTVLTGGVQMKQWRYASPTAIRTITGHGGGVYGVNFSRDGRWIASASADQTVRVWNAATGAQVKQLSGHQGPVYSVAFSPDGALLVSCGADNTVRLWDNLGGRQLKQVPLAEASLYSVAFFADGKRVAAAGLDRKVYILNALTGQVQHALDKHSDFVYRIALNPSGSRLLSCGYGGNIMVFNTANGKQLYSHRLGQVANFADFAPDGVRIVVGGGDGKAYFLDVPANAR